MAIVSSAVTNRGRALYAKGPLAVRGRAIPSGPLKSSISALDPHWGGSLYLKGPL